MADEMPQKNYETVICGNCRQPFEAPRHQHRAFCSDICYRAQKLSAPLICRTCGKECLKRDGSKFSTRRRICTDCRTKHNRGSRLERLYGLSVAEVERRKLAQGMKCAICGEPTDNFHIDHDHKSGSVRGLLCFRCNYMLGYAKENIAILAAAIGYLAAFQFPSPQELNLKLQIDRKRYAE